MRHIKAIAGAAAVFCTVGLQAVTIDLFESAANLDGTVNNPVAGLGVNLAGFDTTTGLGTILISVNGAGLHYAGIFLDHQIDEAIDDEFATVVGAPTAGLSWEIDEPGHVFGDIYDNFVAGTLDNSNAISGEPLDDVSMALAWGFVLNATETASITFIVGEVEPSGFYLRQTDPASGKSIYFSTSLLIKSDTGPGLPDGGSTLALLLAAGAGIAGMRARQRR